MDESSIVAGTSSEAPAVEDVKVDPTGGVEDGTVEKERLAYLEHEEKVVHEYDGDGNVTGFHKEPVTE